MNLESAGPDLLAALAIGLLMGVERGWKWRDAQDGARVAGIRTFALLGLLGGVAGVLWQQASVSVFAAGLVAVTLVLVSAHVLTPDKQDSSITGIVAGMLTFTLGAAAGFGLGDIAAACAVAAVILLGFKTELHRWLRHITREELHAAFTLLLLSVVLLPVLPNADYGPWDAWNPRQIWLLVVLVAGLSFLGYIAVRLVGPKRGLLATGIFGGLASSTALTLSFARLARTRPEHGSILAAGIAFACTTLYVRMAVLIAVVNAELLERVAIPLVSMAAVGITGGLLLAFRVDTSADHDTRLPNPLELRAALGFGVLLAVVLLLTAALQHWFGDQGVLALAVVSGFFDVDSILVSLARMSAETTGAGVAAAGIIIAAACNSLGKAALAAGIGGYALARQVVPVLTAMAAAGALALHLGGG